MKISISNDKKYSIINQKNENKLKNVFAFNKESKQKGISKLNFKKGIIQEPVISKSIFVYTMEVENTSTDVKKNENKDINAIKNNDANTDTVKNNDTNKDTVKNSDTNKDIVKNNDTNINTNEVEDINTDDIEDEEANIDPVDYDETLISLLEDERESLLNRPVQRQPRIRQSNVELLRIIAMLLIIAHHFSRHGKFKFEDKDLSLNRFWLQFIFIGGRISVDIYILITGYFLINSQKIKIEKLLKLILQILSYSLLTYGIGCYFKIKEFSLDTLIMYILPISYDLWWFASNYVILYVLSPTINRFIHSLERETYRNYLILVTFIWCILPTFTLRFYCINELIWFVFLYCLSGYFRKYSVGENLNCLTCIGMSIAFYLIIFLIVLICDIIGTKISFFASVATYLLRMNMMPILLSAVFLFIGFLKMNISSRFINFISATTFGVYLLHDSPVIRIALWEKLFKNKTYQESNILIPYSIGVVLVVFIVCSIVEIIRKYTIELLYLKLIRYVSIKLENLITKFTNSRIIREL